MPKNHGHKGPCAARLLAVLCAIWFLYALTARADGETALLSGGSYQGKMPGGGLAAFSFTAPLSGDYDFSVLSDEDVDTSLGENADRTGEPIAQAEGITSFYTTWSMSAGQVIYMWVEDATAYAASSYPYGYTVAVKAESPAISTNAQALYLDSSAGSSTSLGISSNLPFTATDDAEWLTLSFAQAGGGTRALALTARANPFARPRSCVVTLAGSGATSVPVRVWQDPADTTMVLNATYAGAVVDGSAAGFLFTAPHAGMYTFEGTSSALTLLPTLTDQTTSTVLASDDGGDFRLACRLGEGQTAYLKVKEKTSAQRGEFGVRVTAGALSASTKTVYVPAAGGPSSYFSLTSSANWSATTSDGADWLSLSPASSGGAGTNTLHAQASANEAGGTARAATFTFTTLIGSEMVSLDVAVVQPAPRAGTVLTLDGYCQGATIKGSSTWFGFTAPEAGYYAFESTGSINTRGGVYSRVGGTRLAYDDNSGGGLNFRAVCSLKAGQTVYLRAYGASSRITGSYQVFVVPAQLALDRCAIEMPAAGGYSEAFELQTNATWKASSSASWLKINKTSGGAASAFQLMLKAEANRTGVARTATIRFTAAGLARTLTVSQFATSSDRVLLENATIAGTLLPGGADYYVFTASDAGTYFFETIGSVNTSGALYTSRGGSRLAYDADSGEGYNFKIGRTLNAGQRVWVKVYGGRSTSAGTYQLTARHAELRLGAEIAHMPNGGGTTSTVTVSADVNWKASSNAAWLTPGLLTGKVGNGTIYGKAAANMTGATRTAYLSLTGGGRTYRITVIQPAIPMDVIMETEANYSGHIEYGSGSWYAFTAPDAGTYAFESSGDVDTIATLYTSRSSKPVKTADGGGTGLNFRLTYPMQSGATVYLWVRGVSFATEGDYKLTVIRTSAPAGTGRALVISESSATNGSYSSPSQKTVEIEAGANNLAGISAMLSNTRIAGKPVAVTKMLNPTSWPEVQTAILSTFAGSTASDTNYLYIHAHGAASNGEYYLYVGRSGDKAVSASELKGVLDAIPGRFVLMVDSCYSGLLVSSGARTASPASFAQGFAQSFASTSILASVYGDFASPKYYVLCASGPQESSWMVSLSNLHSESSFRASLFTYALCRAGGWNLVKKASLTKMEADADGDAMVTMAELYPFTRSLTNALVAEVNSKLYTNIAQTVYAYPSGSVGVILVK